MSVILLLLYLLEEQLQLLETIEFTHLHHLEHLLTPLQVYRLSISSSLVVVLVELVMLVLMRMEEEVVLVDIEQTSLVKPLVQAHLLKLHYLYLLEIKQ